MMFAQVGNGRELIPDSYNGVVVKIVNKDKRTVEIEWDENRLHEDNQKKTAVVDSKVQSEETT